MGEICHPSVFLTFIFIGLSKAQTTNDFGMWTTIGTEKNVNDSWSLGVNTEIRTKNNVGSVDRWQLGVSGTYKVSKVMKLGGGYEYPIQLLKRYCHNSFLKTITSCG